VKPWLKSTPFLDRVKPDLDLATAAYRSARRLAEAGDLEAAANMRAQAERIMDRIEQLYDDAQKAESLKPKR
jgi:hypothetical protein